MNNSQCSGHFPKCSFIHSHSQDMNTEKKRKQSSLIFFFVGFREKLYPNGQLTYEKKGRKKIVSIGTKEKKIK